MGFLQARDDKHTLILTMPPPLGGASQQGTVDRLASFFLSKFHETKKDSELTALQCTAKLKFEAAEKRLEEHNLALAALRGEVHSFWDKAPSYFLHKFSAQLDALGAGRSEKCEQAVARLENRVDDEVKNLGDQLADLSTKLAVGAAATSAAVDDVAKKAAASSEAAAESLRRCDSELRSRLERLESLLESNKTDAALERDRINKTFQEASRRLQSKVDSLELTVVRQSEELTGQCDKIDRLEKELQRLSLRTTSQEKGLASAARMLSAQGDELATLQRQVTHPPPPPSRQAASPTPPLPRLALPSSPPYPAEEARGSSFATPMLAIHGQGRVTRSRQQDGRLKRRYENGSEQEQTQAAGTEQSPAQQQSSRCGPSTESAEADRKSTASDPSSRHQAKKPRPAPDRVKKVYERAAASQPTSSHAQTPSPPQSPEQTSTVSATPPRAQNWKGMPHGRETNAPAPAPAPALAPDPGPGPGPEKSNDASSAAPTKNAENSQRQSSALRREATTAFILHIRKYARAFKQEPPRSERAFIWRFLDEIPDPGWADFVQKKLLEAYPSAVRPSVWPRAKHPISFNAGLTWQHVYNLLRSMHQRTAASRPADSQAS